MDKRKYTFLGHDNASLSMLIETLYNLYNKDIRLEIISIVAKEEINKMKVPYLIDGIECEEKIHNHWLPSSESIILLGSTIAKIKKKIFLFYRDNYKIEHEMYSKLFHSKAIISSSCKIAYGSTIGPGSILAPFSSLGNQVSVNRNVTVGHHTTIHDFATLNPGCNIAGYCEIGEGSTIGMGSNIIDGRRIGKNSVIGAGSVVTKHIPDNTIAYGSPAKLIRENKPKKHG